MLYSTPQRLVAIACLCGFIFAASIWAASPPQNAQERRAPGTLALGNPALGVWLDVPFIKQEKDGCGAASIAMVMQYWLKQQGKPIDSSAEMLTIQHELFSAKDHGIRAADMERYFQQHGFRTFAFTGKWDDLKQHLEKGRPLIAALKPSALESSLHYVVVVGVDPEQNVVLLNDAAQRKLLKQDRSSFEKQWSAVKNWTLLALPK
jgi:ABC-type bacteriocin/lantibiotic exporter with double-glycine peptidase domain